MEKLFSKALAHALFGKNVRRLLPLVNAVLDESGAMLTDVLLLMPLIAHRDSRQYEFVL